MPSHSLPSSDIERYSRQMLLPQFGVIGQQNLRDSRILIVGVGGLGCPAALYLAGAGVGTLGLVDRPDDVVEKSNLHRQVAHAEDRVGSNKVDSAEIAIRALNSNVNIQKHKSFVPSNAVDTVSKYKLVLDCTDNVMSRYLISDACAIAKVPLVSGSAIGMEGQLTVYCSSAEAPCYRCIFPRPPPPSCVGSCDSAGVLGPVPGIIGTLQALEALKIVGKIQYTECLERKLLLFDAGESSFRTVTLRGRKRDCVVCGATPTVDVPTFDYEAFALGDASAHPGSRYTDISPKHRMSASDFAKFRKESRRYKLIDVRPRNQFEMCHLEEAESHPLDDLTASGSISNILNGSELTVFICRRGNASRAALNVALKAGASNVCDVIGGLQSWHSTVDNSFPLY